MRTRILLFPSLLLFLALMACSSKPSESAATPADQNATTQEATGSSTASSSTPARGQQSASAPASAGAPMAATEQAAPSAPQPVVVPTGTSLTVRLGESLGSKISSPGQSFSATLSAPVEAGGEVVIPSGATARGVVIDAKPLGKFKGGAVLDIKLTSITVRGTERAIETSSVIRAEKGKGKRTAVVTGGGAALGALIGGLAGGGKGAAIGALAGGGAGATGSALTGNKDIVLPAESALTFRLRAPLELRR